MDSGNPLSVWLPGGGGKCGLARGAAGSDSLIGGLGLDMLFGEAGRDVLYSIEVEGLAEQVDCGENLSG
jgi:Ca2+-binding RTX toxin-like protein